MGEEGGKKRRDARKEGRRHAMVDRDGSRARYRKRGRTCLSNADGFNGVGERRLGPSRGPLGSIKGNLFSFLWLRYRERKDGRKEGRKVSVSITVFKRWNR